MALRAVILYVMGRGGKGVGGMGEGQGQGQGQGVGGCGAQDNAQGGYDAVEGKGEGMGEGKVEGDGEGPRRHRRPESPADKATILELSFGQEEKTGGGAEGVDEETGAGFFRIEPLSFCDHAADNACVDAVALGALTDDFEQLAPCAVCGDAEESIVCAKCLAVHCGRHVKGHGVKHAEETGHCIGVGLRDLSFWCHQCDGYLNNYTIDALKPLYNRLHLCKFKELPAGQ